jgi:S-disulfanyl-L-cysteine oxidoreductase SoxD
VSRDVKQSSQRLEALGIRRFAPLFHSLKQTKRPFANAFTALPSAVDGLCQAWPPRVDFTAGSTVQPSIHGARRIAVGVCYDVACFRDAASNYQGDSNEMNVRGNRHHSKLGIKTLVICGLVVSMGACLGGEMRSARAAGPAPVARLAPRPAPGPAPAKTTLDGVYTDDEAARGKAQYNTTCSACHMEDLSGSGQALPLAGDAFMDIWEGQTMNDFLELVQGTMPQDKPGSLTADQALDVMSYILQQNKFPVGKEELKNDPDTLKGILITKKAPAASAAPSK